MTYFGFLALFLGIPIAGLSLLSIFDIRRGKWLSEKQFTGWAWRGMIGLCFVAFLYTTPWDNYLVATRVWWYDINLVSGIVFGYVPIEEYTFFILQPILGCLIFYTLARYFPTQNPVKNSPKIRMITTGVVFVLWVTFTVVLILTFMLDSFKPATYLSLELSWALIPIMLQFGFGADIIWRHRRNIFLMIAISTLYLSWADSIAIGSGTWTIDPEQSLNIFIGGVLPVEEFVFFLLTNTLVAFGITLIIAQESFNRVTRLDDYAIFRPLVRVFQQTK